MSEPPTIIRQNSEHSVTVTEGSLVATSKPSDPEGPVVRQNLAGDAQADAADAAEPAAGDLPPPFIASAEPEAVIFQRRQDVQTEEAPPDPLPPDPLPSDAPVFERRTPEEPQQNLAVADAQTSEVIDAPEAPDAPEVPEPQAPVFERRIEAPQEPQQDLPVADTQASEAAQSQGPVFERSIEDTLAAVPLPAALDPAQGESAVDRFLRERRLADQQGQQGQQGQESDQGPVLERSMQDRFVPLPPGPEASAPGDGPVFQHAMADRSVAQPTAAGMEQVIEQAIEQVIAQAPREGSSRAPALEPVPLAQAQQIIAETAQHVQARVEEAIGAADGQWAEMDFPARVVKLKMENDKVRVKLEELEHMADEQAQQQAQQRAEQRAK